MDMQTATKSAWDLNENEFPRDGPLEARAWFALRDTLQTGPYPQLLIRVGSGPPATHTPRRAIEDVTS